MALGKSGYGLYIFTLVISLLFPVMSYSFTTLAELGEETYDVTLDPEALLIAGITLQNSVTHNITWKAGSWTIFEFNDTRFRTQWKDQYEPVIPTYMGDGFVFWQPGILGTWVIPYRVIVKNPMTGTKGYIITNSSIITYFRHEYNWTRYDLESGYMVFYSVPVTSDNITDAVMNDAKLTVTIGRALEDTSDFNWLSFLNWYYSLLLGSASYGLPPVFSWFIRILAALMMFSAVMLAKEVLS